MSSVSGISSSMGGGMMINGGPGEAKSVVEGTLSKSAELAAWYKAQMRMPETSEIFPISGRVNTFA